MTKKYYIIDRQFADGQTQKEHEKHLKWKIRVQNKELKLATEFIQYVLDQWDIDTGETQDKAFETLKKMYNCSINTK